MLTLPSLRPGRLCPPRALVTRATIACAFVLLFLASLARADLDVAEIDLAFVPSFQLAGATADQGKADEIASQTSDAEIRFSFNAEGDEAQAFGNQMVAQVQRNLSPFAQVDSPTFTMNPVRLDQQASLDESILENQSPEAASVKNEGSPPPHGLIVEGDITFQNGGLIDMMVQIKGLQSDDRRRESLSLRVDVTDWQRAGNYLSNTLYSRLAGRPGFFQSQVAFVAEVPGPKGPARRLARVDPSGGGLRFVYGAGDQVAFPTFLSNRFEVAFMDQTNGRNRLMHYNILTARMTYMMTLPDLVGAPALARGGRLVAFAAREDTHGGVAADIYISDVERGRIRAIDIPGSRDSYPQFSPDLRMLCFISSRPAWSELVLAQVPYGLVDRDRTRRDADADPMDGLGAEVRSLYGSPHRLHQPVWSPDGQRVAFIESTATDSTLLLHDRGTRQTQGVVQGANMADPVWSPDGREILLVVDGAMVRVNLAERRLTPFWGLFPVSSPTWSRNGSGGSIVETLGPQ